MQLISKLKTEDIWGEIEVNFRAETKTWRNDEQKIEKVKKIRFKLWLKWGLSYLR